MTTEEKTRVQQLRIMAQQILNWAPANTYIGRDADLLTRLMDTCATLDWIADEMQRRDEHARES